MAEIKLTKIELKKQKDNLKRFRRYLPTLYIKKQLLQKEVARINDEIEALKLKEKEILENVMPWQGVFCEDAGLDGIVRIAEITKGKDNIAGVDIPVFESISLEKAPYDLFNSPLWIDEAVTVICDVVNLRVRISILLEQKELLSEELRITAQRVNLFEKVKIPETMEHINKINVYLGDQQTVAAGWARIAKKKVYV